MPYYDHDKDYPFAAFITNLGKYNEGELVGEWVKFPTTAEELKEVFKRIGIGQKDDFGQPYEEWFITDYDCYVDGLYSKLGEYENLDELNYLASKLDEMRESEYAQFQAGMEMGDHCGSLQEIINLTENLDCYEIYPNIEDYDDLGRYYIEELEVSKVPAHLQNYIDYEAYGRDVALEENGTFTDQGYVRDTGDSFHEYYDGERGSIPDEYRVMTFQDDLPEEEKSEWAMDIAFDMDEFFRQNDPQYAAEHPEAHAAKEELYENLMAGRISTLDEKLAALGQTQEDYLPSEIEKFKDATGYEEFLDFDPAEVKAALEDPEKSHADEMLSAAERAASEKMTVLVVEPMKEPYVKEINSDLHSLQAEVGGDIGATYPYSDPVALVCNDEGKLIGLDLNRGLRDENGEIYDIVAGTFLVVGLGEEDFASLSPELIQKYTEQFKTPERFMQINGNIVVLPVPAEKQDLTYLPDRFETGERVQTPRGSFQVTAMSREQMEAAGYGVHHISDDGKYLIIGNGTRAFAVAAEQPENLRPANFNWEQHLVSFTQVKTGEPITLPLPTDVGWAVIDYLKNGRPVSDAPEIFLRAVAPYVSLQNFDNILIKHMRKAGIPLDSIKHHGLHSLRHSLATHMLDEGIPITSIQSVLGHINADSTQKYIGVNVRQLRSCALEVTD